MHFSHTCLFYNITSLHNFCIILSIHHPHSRMGCRHPRLGIFLAASLVTGSAATAVRRISVRRTPKQKQQILSDGSLAIQQRLNSTGQAPPSLRPPQPQWHHLSLPHRNPPLPQRLPRLQLHRLAHPRRQTHPHHPLPQPLPPLRSHRPPSALPAMDIPHRQPRHTGLGHRHDRPCSRRCSI